MTCVAVLVAFGAAAQQQWTVTGIDAPELSAVDEMVRDQMVTHGIRAASVAIAKDGRLVYARGYTWDHPDVDPVQPTSLFRIGSIGKAITSVAIHQLIEDGLLSYETPVAETLGLEPLSGESADPWLEEVTVDHLLTHTVGWDRDSGGIDPMVFRDWYVALANGVFPPPTRREIAAFMTGQPFQFRPGTRWAYCNFGYLLLQMLAEEVTNRDFPEYVHDNLFRSIGVSRARMAHTLRSELAPTERTYDGDYEGDPYQLTAENAYAAGGMVMAAPDLARFLSALFDDQAASGLLGATSLDSMLSLPFQASRDLGYGRGWFHEDFLTNTGHTIGWFSDPGDDLDVFGHGGGGPGTHTIGLWRSDGITFVWFTNKDPLIEDFDDLPVIRDWPGHDLWQSVGISTGAVGSAPVESWIPAVAHADGVGNSVWTTDVGLLNRSTTTNIVRLRYHHLWRDLDTEIELAPGAFQVVRDVVGSFGREGSGPLQVFSSDAVTVTSRVFNQSEGGTYGQSADAVTATGGLEAGESAVLTQLREDRSARTNIGIHNQWRRLAEVDIALYDADGFLISRHTREVWPQHTLQLNRPFFKLGHRNDVESGYAVVTVRSGQDIYAYASVIDNETGDPTSIPMKTGPGHRSQTVAAAVHGEGANASQWRTDLSMLNRSGEDASVQVIFHSQDGATGTLDLFLADGEQYLIDDLVAAVGSSGSGWISIEASNPLLASSRTYNASENGTFGLFLDGVSATETCAEGSIVWLPQLQQNHLYRTNIGVVNTGGESARILITLYDGAGAELATRSRTVAPGGWVQIQEPFARLAGRSDIEAGYARAEIRSGSGVIVSASVIDNTTNDGTSVVAKR
jgi:CubicO group peptidase (beta-lactamase class C family)